MNNNTEAIKNFIATCNASGRDVAVISHDGQIDYYLLNSFDVLENYIEVSGISANSAVEAGIFNTQYTQTTAFQINVGNKVQDLFDAKPIRVRYDKSAKYKVYCK